MYIFSIICYFSKLLVTMTNYLIKKLIFKNLHIGLLFLYIWDYFLKKTEVILLINGESSILFNLVILIIKINQLN